ncbi:Fe3+ hydroxamate ABC transporter substrate-binding protein [Sporosarcina ureilytica]|uniref:Fe3+ hydroxamate ABC transporter substrate-binding protein n=1 Tax=Sporosarcina ureilytica TaxID=298596 RepID=A0A1D8JCA1_9BACL|nr:Fe3+ hydroxamate ABC transporter substrate-binding protein [Sporosarcina ureilytica]
MLNREPKCSRCGIEIKGDDVVLLKMRYPKRKGMVEIKAYLNNEGAFLCENCFQHESK